MMRMPVRSRRGRRLGTDDMSWDGGGGGGAAASADMSAADIWGDSAPDWATAGAGAAADPCANGACDVPAAWGSGGGGGAAFDTWETSRDPAFGIAVSAWSALDQMPASAGTGADGNPVAWPDPWPSDFNAWYSQTFNAGASAPGGSGYQTPSSPDAWAASDRSGAAWATPMAPASPSYSPPPTARGSFNWDAAAGAFTTSMWGGQRFAANAGNPASYYTAPPSYLTAYVNSVQRGAADTLSFQNRMRDQTNQAFQALVQSGAGAASSLNRPFPVVVDPNNPVFQLRLPSDSKQANVGGAGIPLWGYLAAAAAGFLIWRKMRKGGGRAPRPISAGE